MSTPLAALLAAHPLPEVGGDKQARGDVVVAGGPARCPGAAVLAGRAALRVGAGRVQLVVDPSVVAAVGAAFPEALVVGWGDEQVGRFLERAGAVVVGCGLDDGDGPALAMAIAAGVEQGVPLLLDAGSLRSWHGLGEHALVLAPNEDEAVRLLDDPDGSGDGDVADLARRLAAQAGRPVAVRGAASVVADGDGGLWTSADGDPGLGTAGSGDVLAGCLGGFLAAGLDPVAALGWAIDVHARAGALAAAQVGPTGYLAGDVLDRVPRALAEARRAGEAGLERPPSPASTAPVSAADHPT